MLTFLLGSCKENEVKLSKLNENQRLLKGEWFSLNIDTMNVMSVRGERLLFIENYMDLNFTLDDIYNYSIIDSIKKVNDVEIETESYLVLERTKDSLKYKIVSRKDSLIELEINNKIQKFEWRFIARMSE
ncbi:MAG: hypothetical protein AB7D46_07250 [Flavobacteriaceae bacterium]